MKIFLKVITFFVTLLFIATPSYAEMSRAEALNILGPHASNGCNGKARRIAKDHTGPDNEIYYHFVYKCDVITAFVRNDAKTDTHMYTITLNINGDEQVFKLRKGKAWKHFFDAPDGGYSIDDFSYTSKMCLLIVKRNPDGSSRMGTTCDD